MADIGVVITGSRQVELQFEQFPEHLHDKLLARVRSLTSMVASRVRAAVPVKTGKLKGEIVSDIYDDGPTRVAGRVSVSGEYAKAGALEYGAHGTAIVKAHRATLSHVFGRHASPMNVLVAAHTRKLNLPAHRYLHDPFKGLSGEIASQMRETVEEAAAADQS